MDMHIRFLICSKLAHVFLFFHVDSVTFSTPNNMIYYEYTGDNVTLICNVINYVELHWQLKDNTVLTSNSKYQYQVKA